MKHGTVYHQSWCQTVAHKWGHAPRRVLVAMLADVGARTPCRECGQLLKMAKASPAQKDQMPSQPTAQPEPTDGVIPLRVIGLAHGVLFLAARPEHRERLKETAVEPATPLYIGGLRGGTVVRLDASRAEPLLVVQMDPRATFRNGPYQARLRHPLRRLATKPFALAFIEPASEK